jgi:hypothetical protein
MYDNPGSAGHGWVRLQAAMQNTGVWAEESLPIEWRGIAAILRTQQATTNGLATSAERKSVATRNIW